MCSSRDAELRRARVAALIASAALAVSGCSGGGQDGAEGQGKSAACAPGVHSWTSRPCELLAGAPPAEGFTVGSTTDSADPDTREDIGEKGTRHRYRQAGCLAGLTGADGASWKLSATAAVYEDAGPARRAYRIKEDLDRAHGRGPERVHDAAYGKPADDQGRPGRTLLLWNGDLLLSVTAYGPYGSKEHDVREDLGRIVENTARLVEDGLRDGDAPSPVRTTS
ncbi:hypothetical protein GTY67_32630 [Streptomyces sp. SID8374]|uniref:hypothetical protein n=1 Tax=Streptomyces sp. SID8374 TaxID=2690354 RepID=UPI001368B189|nr:hypothetical protein [Streptomyces sp. SID8374]MYX18096.1 hypothetical protein [Streptomyces sp. SID8374]